MNTRFTLLKHCTYCWKPPVQMFWYQSIAWPSRRVSVLHVAACADHAGCANFTSMYQIQSERGRIVKESGMDAQVPARG